MITLDKIKELWEQDRKIDFTEPGKESINIPLLHGKYYPLLIDCKRQHNKDMMIFKKLYLKKFEYFLGIMTIEECNKFGWEPIRYKILRQDIDKYLDADEDLSKMTKSIQETKFAIDYVESILSNLNQRNFQIKNFIDHQRFINGL